MAAGSVRGGLRHSEQGDVISAHYGNRAISPRELDQVTHAVFGASTLEHERSVTGLLSVTGRGRLPDASPVLQRSIELRNPYVEPLSQVQVGSWRVWVRYRRTIRGGSDCAGRSS